MRSFWFVIVLSAVLNGWAATTVDQTLDASELLEISIENRRGKVSVTGDDSQQIRILGTLDEVAEGLTFERRGHSAVVIVEMPESRQLRGRNGSDLQLVVPRELLVRFKGVSSSIDIKNTHGGAELSTVSGSIKVVQSRGMFQLTSVSGVIVIANSEGDLTASNVSGDIVANVTSPKLQVSVISGNAKLTVKELDQAVVSSVSGDLEMAFKVSEAPHIKVTSVTGEASLQLLNPLNAEIRLQTGPGGDIQNKLNDRTASLSLVQDKTLEYSLGTGAGKLQMSSVSGSLIIQ